MMATTAKLGDPLQIDTRGIVSSITVRMADGTEHSTPALTARLVARALRDDADERDARTMSDIQDAIASLSGVVFAPTDVRLTRTRLAQLRTFAVNLADALDVARERLDASEHNRALAARILADGAEEVEW